MIIISQKQTASNAIAWVIFILIPYRNSRVSISYSIFFRHNLYGYNSQKNALRLPLVAWVVLEQAWNHCSFLLDVQLFQFLFSFYALVPSASFFLLFCVNTHFKLLSKIFGSLICPTMDDLLPIHTKGRVNSLHDFSYQKYLLYLPSNYQRSF